MFRFRSLWRFSTVHFHQGNPSLQASENVTLRGVTLKGRYNDLPNLIFIPEVLDPIENWIPFFTDKDNHILDYRNVHIVSARNFGNSDRNPSFDIEDQANDVLRYMYYNKITMATLAGHGLGARVALATGCYHTERVTGVFAIDYTPMDLRYHESFKELQGYILKLRDVNLKQQKGAIDAKLKEIVECPKWRSILSQNLKRSGEGYEWRFNFEDLYHNLSFNKGDSLGYWPTKCGLFTGRINFAFPEYSRWVHLGTNTMPMLIKCTQLKGFGQDILSIQGDENPLNHWVYEFPDQTFAFSRKLTRFLSLYDGVHVLLQDRSEVGKYYIPEVINTKKDPNHVYSDYTPAHYYHNWRFNNVYKKQ